MSFKFNFGQSDRAEHVDTSEELVLAPGKLVEVGETIVFNGEVVDVETNDEKIKIIKRAYHDIKFEMAQAEESELSKVAFGSNDVIKGQYEGGLKTWECSLDLVVLLSTMKEAVSGKNVIELGSGSSLPGI
jgi:hypothetical protein